MTYYEEDNPTKEEWVEKFKEAVKTDNSEKVPGNPAQERHEELMEMLGGIFVQVSRMYDALMLLLDDNDRVAMDYTHSRGQLFGTPPQLVENAWSEEENN